MEFKILKHNQHYQGFFRFDSYELQHELYAGGWSRPLRRELLERGDAVAVLLHDPEEDTVLLVEQFRVGAIHDDNGPWMVEIVAGMIESGESPESVAIREVKEEVGCRISAVEPILDYYPSAGGCSEQIMLYYAPLSLAGVEDGLYGLAEEDEDIRAMVVPRERAMEWIDTGKIKSSLAIIALQWLALRLMAKRD